MQLGVLRDFTCLPLLLLLDPFAAQPPLLNPVLLNSRAAPTG